MADDAGRLDEGADVRDAPEDVIRPERPAKKLDVADAVQQGDDEGIGPESGPERLGGGFAVVGLDREQHAIGGAERGRIVARPDGPELDVPELAADREAVHAHRLEVPAARDETDLVPGGGQPGTEVPADAPRAHHGELHCPMPSLVLRSWSALRGPGGRLAHSRGRALRIRPPGQTGGYRPGGPGGPGARGTAPHRRLPPGPGPPRWPDD